MKKIIFSLIAVMAFGNLYANSELNRCHGCHGTNFEVSAFNKSKIVSDMDELEIAEVLKGYKNGTYGGPLKAMMKIQVARYDDKTLEDMAKEIKSK